MTNQIMKKLIEASSLIITFICEPPFSFMYLDSKSHAKNVMATKVYKIIEIINEFKRWRVKVSSVG